MAALSCPLIPKVTTTAPLPSPGGLISAPSALLGDVLFSREVAGSRLPEPRDGREDFELDVEWWADSSSSLMAESQQTNRGLSGTTSCPQATGPANSKASAQPRGLSRGPVWSRLSYNWGISV